MLCTRQVHVGTTTLLYTKTNLQISDRAKNLINNKKSFGDLFTGAFLFMCDYVGCQAAGPYICFAVRRGRRTLHFGGRGNPAPTKCDLSHRNYSLFIFHYSFIDTVRHKCRTLRFFLQAMLAPATHIKKRALRLSFLLRILNYSFTYALTYVN